MSFIKLELSVEQYVGTELCQISFFFFENRLICFPAEIKKLVHLAKHEACKQVKQVAKLCQE